MNIQQAHGKPPPIVSSLMCAVSERTFRGCYSASRGKKSFYTSIARWTFLVLFYLYLKSLGAVDKEHHDHCLTLWASDVINDGVELDRLPFPEFQLCQRPCWVSFSPDLVILCEDLMTTDIKRLNGLSTGQGCTLITSNWIDLGCIVSLNRNLLPLKVYVQPIKKEWK